MKDEKYYKELGDFMKSIRMEKRMSLNDVCERFKPVIAKSTLKRYEDGITRISMETLEKWCKALRVNEKQVINHVIYKVDTDEIARIFEEEQIQTYDRFYSYYDEEEARLMKLFANLSVEQKRLLEPIMKSMTGK